MRLFDLLFYQHAITAEYGRTVWNLIWRRDNIFVGIRKHHPNTLLGVAFKALFSVYLSPQWGLCHRLPNFWFWLVTSTSAIMHPDSMSLTIYLTPLPKPSKKAVKATLMDASKKKDKKKGSMQLVYRTFQRSSTISEGTPPALTLLW